MSTNIKVSFVLPVYNVAVFLPQCLDSLCGQTLEEIEIICVDDGSSDDSLDILNQYGEKDARFVVLENTIPCAGAGEARNLGLSQARGEYVLVVDSDDYFHPTLAEKTYEKAVATGADLVLFDVVKFDTHTGEQTATHQFLNRELYKALGREPVFAPEEVADYLFLLFDGVVWNKLIRRSLIEKHGCRFFPVHVVDDMNFTFSVAVFAQKIAVVEEVLLYYRVGNGSSQMSNLHRDPLTPVKVLSRLYSFLQEQQLFSIYEKTYVERGIGLCMFYFDGLSGQDCFFDLYQALHTQAEKDLGWTGSSLSLLDGDIKKQWIEDVYQLSAEAFLEKQKNRSNLLSGKNYGIYGFGVRTALVYENIVKAGGLVSCIVDSSVQKQGQMFQSYEIQSPQNLPMEALDYVVITTANYFEEMKQTLLALGFSSQQIIFM